MGQRKVFVSVDGTLHICERINNTLPIGSVYTGFDISRICELRNEYSRLMNEEDCLTCPVVRFCPTCYATLAGEGEFSWQKKQARCKGIRKSFEKDLALFCRILEIEPNALDYMQDIIIG